MKKRIRSKNYARAQKNASIYFLLWAVLSFFALLIVILMGVIQNLTFKRTYRDEIERTLASNGENIRNELLTYPGPYFSAFIRKQSSRYNVGVFVLREDGTVVFPEEEDLSDGADEQVLEMPDFTGRIERLKSRLSSANAEVVLYEDSKEGEYVYGAVMSYRNDPVYLYVCKPLSLIKEVVAQTNFRIVLTAIFVLILAFAVSSAISGFLTDPLAEMTDKAKLLAHGDFSVDFNGKSYGSELQALASTLNFARDELSKSDRMQKELIANVSHDFKTPLTMIKAYASMIQEISGDNPEKRNKHTQVIIDEADRLTSLVNDVLDLSKIRSGINSVKPQLMNLSEYTRGVLEKFDYLAETQGYKFEAEICDGLYTEADPVKIGEVLYNLIGNAVNYTGEDKRVKVSLTGEEDCTIRFAVTDTGKGIKPEELTTIWDRYYRSSEAHKRPVQGTGLGLSIVKTILEKHNFRFGVESTVGKGSTFYVIFPLRNPPVGE